MGYEIRLHKVNGGFDELILNCDSLDKAESIVKTLYTGDYIIIDGKEIYNKFTIHRIKVITNEI